jgi:hypothetical protein
VQLTSVVRKDTASVLDVLGPTLAILSPTSEDAAYCMMIGTIPAGVCVPLWGIGGKPLTTADGKALAAGKSTA